MSERVPCCYCGELMTISGVKPHERRCFWGPEGERLKKYVRERVRRNGKLTMEEWKTCKERKGLGLASHEYIVRIFGTWGKFIIWCGVEYERKHDQSYRQQKLEDTLIAVSKRMEKRLRHAQEAERYYSEPQFINRGIKRIYNWRTMRYENVHVSEWR